MSSTLRDVMVANIDDAKAKVVSLEAELAKMDSEGGSFLSREVGELQSWLQGLAAHVFRRGQVASAPVADISADATPAVVAPTESSAAPAAVPAATPDTPAVAQ